MMIIPDNVSRKQMAYIPYCLFRNGQNTLLKFPWWQSPEHQDNAPLKCSSGGLSFKGNSNIPSSGILRRQLH